MSDARTTKGLESARRLGAERRAASAVLVNYIHERSSRHGREATRRALPPRPSRTLAGGRAADGCWA